MNIYKEYDVKMFKYGTLLLVYCNDVRLTLFQNTFSILQPIVY